MWGVKYNIWAICHKDGVSEREARRETGLLYAYARGSNWGYVTLFVYSFFWVVSILFFFVACLFQINSHCLIFLYLFFAKHTEQIFKRLAGG